MRHFGGYERIDSSAGSTLDGEMYNEYFTLYNVEMGMGVQMNGVKRT
jgi:hypothetical protein